MRKTSVGVLGATGMVGQMLVRLLESHPWFELTEVAASEKSAGKDYGDVMAERWSVSQEIPEYARNLKVKECRPDLNCDLVFSALDSGVAQGIESDFAKNGYAVSSNAKNHRMEPDVPLLIPEINADHVRLIDEQRKRRGWRGFIVTDPNCSTIHMSLALKPLHDSFGLKRVMVTTMQALSGAGYPGVPSLDIVDNVVPFIKDEEEKLQTEPLKIFGGMKSNKIENAHFVLSAQCNRVGVKYGHMECVNVELDKKAKLEEVVSAFENFRDPIKSLKLPSAPSRPVVVSKAANRPQPKLDVNAESGMASVVGRIRKDTILDYKFVVLGHNLVRGAAGAAILNGELLRVKGYLEE